MSTGAFSRSRFLREGPPRPLVLAHRGASAQETENTLAAFRRAIALGADGVELDVQRCATGEVVVFHDDDLERLAGRPERVDRLSLSALREVRLAGGGEIPTLAEALAACGDALVNIEIKYDGVLPGGCRALVAGVAEAVARAGAAERVLVSSFSPAAVWRWRALRPDVPCGLLFERPRPFRRPWPMRMDWLLAAAAPDRRASGSAFVHAGDGRRLAPPRLPGERLDGGPARAHRRAGHHGRLGDHHQPARPGAVRVGLDPPIQRWLTCAT